MKLISSLEIGTSIDNAWQASRNSRSSTCTDNSLFWKGFTTTTKIVLDEGKYPTYIALASEILKMAKETRRLGKEKKKKHTPIFSVERKNILNQGNLTNYQTRHNA